MEKGSHLFVLFKEREPEKGEGGPLTEMFRSWETRKTPAQYSDGAGVESGTFYKFRGELVLSFSNAPKATATNKNAYLPWPI